MVLFGLVEKLGCQIGREISNGKVVQTNSGTALMDSSAKGYRVGIWALCHLGHEIRELLVHTGKAYNTTDRSSDYWLTAQKV